MNFNKENIARFGIATKGFVYTLMGVLTFMAAIGSGGTKSGTSDALKFLQNNTVGTILLGITAIGLVAYVFWRFYQAIKDPDKEGTDLKGIGNRLGFFSSGVFYGLLAFSAFEILIGSGSGSGDGQESLITSALTKPSGQIIVLIIATIILGRAIFQMVIAYTNLYKKRMKAQNLGPKTEKLMITLGKIGHTSRGIVIGVVAFLTYRAAFSYSTEEAGGTKDAFSFLQDEFGTIVLSLVALGLAMYGIFLLINAWYRDMKRV
ncbi:DUF1206 domain-containing protein [Algoriphagus winogradskyi]|uniref:DUF1206 domain-containing protein n=1 Tax=Algoriphagus winogradskyi TaxID=237017 RepID=A0ABY1P888_9BACT|nr:DUF1206 domain-containing protein [Algoriphagus winogradskyi]SMP27480.1 protein of unknown function [Algoriphagus winogradskyi]